MRELWTMADKAILLFYLILAVYLTPALDSSWHVFFYLLYICLNVAEGIFKKVSFKLILALLSIIAIGVGASVLNPLFWVLLPPNLYEVATYRVHRSRIVGLLMLIPVIWIPQSLYPDYIALALLSFLLCAGAGYYEQRLRKQQNKMEDMERKIVQLSRSLHDRNAYIRQSDYTVRLEERNRLSQQIHDEIGHAMAGGLIQMEAAKRLLGVDHRKAQELLGNAITISKEGLEQIRLTLKDMKPKQEELGFNRLRLFVHELSLQYPMRINLTHRGDMDTITPYQWRIIIDNIVEAVTNSLKYSGASVLEIEISLLPRFVRVGVRDNGRGAGAVIKGLGILGMEERTAEAGGTVIVDGSKGFSVIILLPIQQKL